VRVGNKPDADGLGSGHQGLTCPNHPRPQVHSVLAGVAVDWVVRRHLLTGHQTAHR
jgi:hypothetical protein